MPPSTDQALAGPFGLPPLEEADPGLRARAEAGDVHAAEILATEYSPVSRRQQAAEALVAQAAAIAQRAPLGVPNRCLLSGRPISADEALADDLAVIGRRLAVMQRAADYLASLLAPDPTSNPKGSR